MSVAGGSERAGGMQRGEECDGGQECEQVQCALAWGQLHWGGTRAGDVEPGNCEMPGVWMWALQV